MPETDAEKTEFLDLANKTMSSLRHMFDKLCVRHGSTLIPRSQKKSWGTDGPKFLHCLMNPSERKIAEENLSTLNDDVRNGAWQVSCSKVAEVIQPWLLQPQESTSVDEVRKALASGKCRLFNGNRRHYSSVRFSRSILDALA